MSEVIGREVFFQLDETEFREWRKEVAENLKMIYIAATVEEAEL